MNGDLALDTPMLGALLVAEGLIAPEQLNACLLLQQHDYPNLRLGEILMRCGYISQESLEGALQLQRAMQDSLTAAFEAHMPIATDVSVLVVARRPAEVLSAILARLGAAVSYSRELPADIGDQPPDLLLIEAAKLQEIGDLPDCCPVELLPDISRHLYANTVPAGIIKLIERYVGRVREERARSQKGDERWRANIALDALTLATRSIAEAKTEHELLTRLTVLARDLLVVEAATMFRADTKNARLVFEVVFGPNQQSLAQKTLPIDHGIVGWVACHGEPLIIPDVRHDRRFAGGTDNSTGFQTRSMLCVPMQAFGKLYGVLQLINKQDGEFNERDLQLLRAIASFGALALACKPTPILRSRALHERVLAASA